MAVPIKNQDTKKKNATAKLHWTKALESQNFKPETCFWDLVIVSILYCSANRNETREINLLDETIP